jgi:hypothetical protein
MKALRYLLLVASLVVGGVLVLYGLLGLIYTGESGSGRTYVKLAGHEQDAHLVGALSLGLGVIVIAFGVLIARALRASTRPRASTSSAGSPRP